jgi:hypothetical protein
MSFPGPYGPGYLKLPEGPVKGENMILGHDFKYSIPEMDHLVAAAKDLGIHLSNNSETVSYPDGRIFLIQIVSVEINGNVLQLMASSREVHARNGVKIIPFPVKDVTKKGIA